MRPGELIRLRNLSSRLFGRGLLLPVAVWFLDRRQEAVYPKELTTALVEAGIKASESQVGYELLELEDLGMIRRGEKEWRATPYFFVRDSDFWAIIRDARRTAARWEGEPSRRPGRAPRTA